MAPTSSAPKTDVFISAIKELDERATHLQHCKSFLLTYLAESAAVAILDSCPVVAAAAQDMKSPRIAPTHVDWDAVAVELGALDVPKPVVVPEVMAKLNRATSERFANIAASPIPVLLPFDTAAFARDRAAADPAAANANASTNAYLFGFNAVPFFYPGPAGYDAVVVARAQDMPELGVGFSDTIYIHIGGSALIYELEEPRGMVGWPVHDLDEFPRIRRMFLEHYVRYTFVRYGVPYVVSIE